MSWVQGAALEPTDDQNCLWQRHRSMSQQVENDGLLPPMEPYRLGRIQVVGSHELYFEESGTPYGMPVLVLHGGLGSGSSPKL